MPSEKVTRILKAKSPFNEAEIAKMSDAQGWDWIYANAKPRKEKLTRVCFTGFSATDKAYLTSLAESANLEVVGSVTKSLAFLCVGENAGPAKLAKAQEQGNHILSKEQFMHLLETGEISSNA
jgi:NAD-dependent DNA ligase